MAWVSPKSWTSGELVASVQMNTMLRENECIERAMPRRVAVSGPSAFLLGLGAFIKRRQKVMEETGGKHA